LGTPPLKQEKVERRQGFTIKDILLFPIYYLLFAICY